MDTYFFRSLPLKYRKGFRKYYTLQNLKAAQIAAVVFFAINIFLRLLYTVLPESTTHADNFPEFNTTNLGFLLATPVFIIAANLLLSKYKKQEQPNVMMSLVVNCFSLYIIAAGLAASIISTHDPRNSMVIYVIAVIFIGLVFLYEWEDTIMLGVFTEIIFTAALFYCNLYTTEMMYNELIGFVLITGFFFISRYTYSYRAAHYMQLMQIREKNVEIEKASLFKNEVLGMVAHDLRNPIGAVESVAMIMELEPLDDDMQDNVNMIKASCEKALAIINDLLEVARNDNIDVLQTERVELNQLLNHIIHAWQFGKNVRNNIALISGKQPLYANINPEKFHRVIDNLISNAIKFSKDEDTIELYLNKTKQGIHIEVRDHGMGIPKEMLPHIFERFSKAGRKGIRGELSTGLGLSIVRQIVEKHNGKIEVQSEEKRGSVFKISLPEAV
ncbi:sensor histidine kinase [Mucilaginibacter sp. KACC 22063]|uniref:sensor histidine kinase n=1 Tax=Mucilaginibacter sp. KACC 22063 TaxID=3025666 RepID=UPI00236539FF|nr:HAMP domain-containing sensor histidine kinase [Mucilaginibacter sp. KACC 22063]WDF53863.1 HAMP domain-containing sensor histidine kinase [Mucilaginibacter sp. KACC 22063]